jgi:hypothetical protein
VYDRSSDKETCKLSHKYLIQIRMYIHSFFKSVCHFEYWKRSMQYAWLPDNTNWKVKYVVKDYRNDEYEAGWLSSSCY